VPDILLEHMDLITMEADVGVIEDGYMAIKDGHIEAIGKSSELRSGDYVGYERIKSPKCGKRFIALPGFVQTHVHTSQALGRGLADDVDLITWTRKRIWPYEAALTEDDVYISALLSTAEMLKSGTTTFCEASGVKPDAIAKAVLDSGMRGIVCLSTMDLPGEIPPESRMNTQEAIERNLAVVETWQGKHERIGACFNILNLFLSSDRLWRSLTELAVDKKVFLQTHLAESLDEVAFIQEKSGKSPVQFLESLGALGPHLLAAHVVHVDDDDLALLKERDVKVLHCPGAGLRIAGIARIPEMLAMGILVSLGTNSPPCNNRMSMLDEMWLAGIMHKAVENNPQAVPATSVLEMATINGAKTLGMDQTVGTLAVGKKADIAILDFNKLYTTPTHELFSTLVYQANNAVVDTVIVDGEILVEGGKLTSINEDWLIAEAERRARDIVKRANIKF
jgi:5-methylthioadenosine/S-adenosylhomocysteine deaminase